MHTRSTSKRLRVDALTDKENQHASQAAKKARLEVARPTPTPAANTFKRHLRQDVSSVAARTALWVHEVSNAAGNAKAVQVRSSKDEEDTIGDENDCKTLDADDGNRLAPVPDPQPSASGVYEEEEYGDEEEDELDDETMEAALAMGTTLLMQQTALLMLIALHRQGRI